MGEDYSLSVNLSAFRRLEQKVAALGRRVKLLEGDDAGGKQGEPDAKEHLIGGLLWHSTWESAMDCGACRTRWEKAKEAQS